jgi:Histidine kinase-, DNA gyrase B-, and HSP90-like ATPase
MSVSTHKIKAKSHILSLLGDELIGSDSLAIFELVKNAYDADADNINIEFIDLNTRNQKIVIEDDGHGMTSDVIQNIWLTIGTDFKRGIKRKPSPKYGRASLGNKGVGRLAVHKLAQEITVETQTNGEIFSNRLNINWKKLIESKEYIQDLTVDVDLVGESLFKKGHGTRIILSGLITKNWTRLSLRDLARKIENIKNPFQEVSNFEINILANDTHQSWINDIKSSTEILNDSLYQFDFEINKWKNKNSQNADEDLAEFRYSYKFNPHILTNIKIENNIEKSQKASILENNNTFLIGDIFKGIEEDENLNKYLRNFDLNNIGTIKGRFFVFNQDPNLFKLYFGGQQSAVKEYIKQNYGVKVFRDDIRVYNYGELYDDWLGLDLLKIKRAGDHFGRKVTIGAIEITLKDSENGLKEKTNREGFNENYEFLKFQTLVNRVYKFFEETSKVDKVKIDAFLDDIKPINKVGLSETIKELSEKIKDKNLEKELIPLVKRVEKDYNEMRDVMVNSGITGLNLGIVFHEVDREMRFINSDLNINDVNIENIRIRVRNLIQILENFSPILKQNKKIKISASSLVERSKEINSSRFNYHNIIFLSPILTKENKDFQIFGAGNLLISALSNLIDNSIYWVGARKDLTNDNFKGGIYIGTDITSFDGPAIIIADNGNGFSMLPEDLIMPFRTLKPGGMGLGLYFSNLVMEMMGGKLIFPDNLDLDIPSVYNGACIALVFPKN